jgi:hypothetical protein
MSVFVGTLLVVLAGCASGGTGTPRNDEPVSGGEVAEFSNIRLAIDRLRPSWPRRAREVFVDNQYAGSVSILRNSFNERISFIELVPSSQVVRRFGPCQAPSGTGTLDTPRDPQCGTRPVIHIVLYSGG